MVEWKIDAHVERLLNEFLEERKRKGTSDTFFFSIEEVNYTTREYVKEIHFGSARGRRWYQIWLKKAEEQERGAKYTA